MLFLALTLASAPPAYGQVLAGAAFEHLVKKTDKTCKARKVKTITPGDLDYIQEDFENSLPRTTQLRLRSVNRAEQKCSGSNGLSCQTAATLEAFARSGLESSFASYICSHPNPKTSVTIKRRDAAVLPTRQP